MAGLKLNARGRDRSDDVSTDGIADDRIDGFRTRLSAVRREVDKASGRRETLERRLDALHNDVGLAKGRMQLKPDVDAFLESLQSDLHRRAVGSYERLLTAISEDILGSQNRIGLDLYTERGLPALDIFLDVNGKRVDLVEGCGGSMTNVVSFGLRMIATVRSGMRKFVAVDEPDCWIRPSTVPKFYKVVDDLGAKLGVQSLLISHHDIELMPEGFAVARLYTDNGRVLCQNDPKAEKWEDGQTGIRRLRLVDYMSHEDTEVRLAPGATALIGENHIGKSVAIRGLRALAYGDINDADLRHGAKKVSVEAEVENGLVVRLTRQPGRNPVNEWTLEDRDGNVVTDQETRVEYRTGGRTAPEWVGRYLGIEKFEGIEPQISHQKFPVFLLGEPASRRASVLSIGRESGYVQKMIARQRETGRTDQKTIKDGEVEVGQINEQLAELEIYDDVRKKIDDYDARLAEIRDGQQRLRRIENMIARVEQSDRRLAQIKPLASVLSCMKIEVPDISEGIRLAREIETIGRRMSETTKRIDRARAILASFPERMPDAPTIDGGEAISKMIARVEASDAKLERTRRTLDADTKSLEEAREAFDAEIDKNDGVCPLCEQQIAHQHQVV